MQIEPYWLCHDEASESWHRDTVADCCLSGEDDSVAQYVYDGSTGKVHGDAHMQGRYCRINKALATTTTTDTIGVGVGSYGICSRRSAVFRFAWCELASKSLPVEADTAELHKLALCPRPLAHEARLGGDRGLK